MQPSPSSPLPPPRIDKEHMKMGICGHEYAIQANRRMRKTRNPNPRPIDLLNSVLARTSGLPRTIERGLEFPGTRHPGAADSPWTVASAAMAWRVLMQALVAPAGRIPSASSCSSHLGLCSSIRTDETGWSHGASIPGFWQDCW